mgnify:CR=1 FL=1
MRTTSRSNNMKGEDIKNASKELVNEIAKANQITSDTDVHEVFLSAERIISWLAYLISPIADMEQEYRIKAIPTEKQSNANAEAIAKASDEYKKWRKYTALYELAQEQIMLLKKFKENLELERQRTK